MEEQRQDARIESFCLCCDITYGHGVSNSWSSAVESADVPGDGSHVRAVRENPKGKIFEDCIIFRKARFDSVRADVSQESEDAKEVKKQIAQSLLKNKDLLRKYNNCFFSVVQCSNGRGRVRLRIEVRKN